ncbi:MAG TPA: alpha/beta fold hydrolase [Homoserinimonas sp.]|nr:alpha/beta fold hydrolase [Homoserinimonas sp.]
MGILEQDGIVKVEYTIPGMHVTDHTVTVPLDWAAPYDGRTIEVFAREVVEPSRRREQLPILVFLQGGPGGKSPRPMPGEGWVADALKTHRVLLVDQRGTGRSSRVQGSAIAAMPTAEAVNFLLCFRADSIVADLEHLRSTVFGGVKWQTLGQSYGGFITLAYLSAHPDALSACYVAGGLTSIDPSAADVYRHTYPRVAAKTQAYYRRFPGDAELVGRVADALTGDDVMLPDGDRLTVRRLQTLGLDLGMAPGAERMHWLFDEAFVGGALSDTFLDQVMQRTGYVDNPLFVVMQESIYGNGAGATRWAAQHIRSEFPEFDSAARPLVFTGEMMFPWMLDEIRSLRPFAAAADALAEYEQYTTLYDAQRLASNEVPVAAVGYFDDMYVDVGYSLDTQRRLGNCHLWITNEYEHDGIRQDATVVRRLIDTVADRGGVL